MNDWRKQFDERFNFWKHVVITPRQAGDHKLAEIVQKLYRNTGEDIKAFIASTLAEEQKRVVGILEGMKQPEKKLEASDDGQPIRIVVYNAALTDAIHKITGGDA